MAGIYIHIPFCRSRCIYCGFYSTTALQLRQEYVEAVCRELEKRAFEEGERVFEEGGRRIPDKHYLSRRGNTVANDDWTIKTDSRCCIYI